MKNLIREGSNGPAILSVKLLNEGPDAFESEEYGNRITIRRRIFYNNRSDYALITSQEKGEKVRKYAVVSMSLFPL
jgi:hypothetical protein